MLNVYDHPVVMIVQGIEDIYDNIFYAQKKKSDFITKINNLKNITFSSLSMKQKENLDKLLSKILFDLMKVDVTINLSDLNNKTTTEILLEYFQHVLRCVYFRLDESDKRLLMHYSPIATYSRTWNAFTRAARGIVIDLEKMKIVVHPYDKFFNYREMPETQEANLPNGLKYEDAVKLDGSEGIAYRTIDGTIKIITKGGFDTEQSKFATKLLFDKYFHAIRKIDEYFDQYTFVFEILYGSDDPNRIVVDYGKDPDLRLIGVRDLENDAMLFYRDVQKWAQILEVPAVQTEIMTLEQLMLEKSKRKNFEGWVRRYENGLYMKIKCDEYLDHHGARFGTSEKAVWNMLREEKWDDFISNVPEEFAGVSKALHKKIVDFANHQQETILNAYKTIPNFNEQRDFAIYVNQCIDPELRGFMFGLKAGRELNYIKNTASWIKFRDAMREFYQEEGK